MRSTNKNKASDREAEQSFVGVKPNGKADVVEHNPDCNEHQDVVEHSSYV